MNESTLIWILGALLTAATLIISYGAAKVSAVNTKLAHMDGRMSTEFENIKTQLQDLKQSVNHHATEISNIRAGGR
jgi:uncharacterized membrane-anchored protein YhcB (DUF1043 family)